MERGAQRWSPSKRRRTTFDSCNTPYDVVPDLSRPCVMCDACSEARRVLTTSCEWNTLSRVLHMRTRQRRCCCGHNHLLSVGWMMEMKKSFFFPFSFLIVDVSHELIRMSVDGRHLACITSDSAPRDSLTLECRDAEESEKKPIYLFIKWLCGQSPYICACACACALCIVHDLECVHLDGKDDPRYNFTTWLHTHIQHIFCMCPALNSHKNTVCTVQCTHVRRYVALAMYNVHWHSTSATAHRIPTYITSYTPYTSYM